MGASFLLKTYPHERKLHWPFCAISPSSGIGRGHEQFTKTKRIFSFRRCWFFMCWTNALATFENAFVMRKKTEGLKLDS